MCGFLLLGPWGILLYSVAVKQSFPIELFILFLLLLFFQGQGIYNCIRQEVLPKLYMKQYQNTSFLTEYPRH